MSKSLIVAVDFDGTLVAHEYPDIGAEVHGAFDVLRALRDAGHRLVLWTMRSDSERAGPVLTAAVAFCAARGITFFGVNANPQQDWSTSPKAYAHVYIDDAAIGCPLVRPADARPFVDWIAVRGHLEADGVLPR